MRVNLKKILLMDEDNAADLLQEIYNNSNELITEAQSAIAEMSNRANVNAGDIEEYVQIAKSKEGLLKTKSDAIKMKLEVARLQIAFLSKNTVKKDEESPQSPSKGISINDLKFIKDEIAKIKDGDRAETYELKDPPQDPVKPDLQ